MSSIPQPEDWRSLLRKGDRGADVCAWQTVLISNGAVFIEDTPGDFGTETHNSTMSFQLKHNIGTDGIVGKKTRGMIDMPFEPEPINPAIDLGAISFIEAVNYSRHLPPREEVNWIVIHCMEGPETETRAERCAMRFADEENAPMASCHYCIDCDSIVQCVPEKMIAWHAPGANKRGIGIEHAGYARQTEEQWLDTYGKRMLTNSAYLVAQVCKRWNIPVEYVNAAGILTGKRGITTHADVSKAKKKSSHWDPGPGFPMDWYVEQVRSMG